MWGLACAVILTNEPWGNCTFGTWTRCMNQYNTCYRFILRSFNVLALAGVTIFIQSLFILVVNQHNTSPTNDINCTLDDTLMFASMLMFVTSMYNEIGKTVCLFFQVLIFQPDTMSYDCLSKEKIDCHEFFICAMLLLTCFFLECSLLWVGAEFLEKSTDNISVVRGSVALQFILRVSEMIYHAAMPSAYKVIRKEIVMKWSIKNNELFHSCDFKVYPCIRILLIVFVTWLFFYFQFMYPCSYPALITNQTNISQF